MSREIPWDTATPTRPNRAAVRYSRTVTWSDNFGRSVVRLSDESGPGETYQELRERVDKEVWTAATAQGYKPRGWWARLLNGPTR